MKTFEEIRDSIGRRPLHFISLAFYFFTIFLCLSLLFANLYQASSRSWYLSSFHDNLFRLMDADDAASYSYRTNPSKIESLKKFHHELSSDPHFAFFEAILQPANILNFKGGEIFFDGYEFGNSTPGFIENGLFYHPIKRVMINQAYAQETHLDNHLLEGRIFSKMDYEIPRSSDIPVILGYEYHGIYQIGDRIPSLLWQNLPCYYQVVGILKKDFPLIANDHHLFMDRYLITPSQNINTKPQNMDEVKYQGTLYLQKINGSVKLSENFSLSKFLTKLERLRLKYSLYDIILLRHTPAGLHSLKLLAYEGILILFTLFVIAMFFAFLTLILYVIGVIQSDLYRYKVFLLCGYSFGDLRKILFGEIAVALLLAAALNLFIMDLVMKEIVFISFLFLLILSMLLMATTYILIKLRLNDIEMSTLSQGVDHD